VIREWIVAGVTDMVKLRSTVREMEEGVYFGWFDGLTTCVIRAYTGLLA